jgi:hypothetical protein
MFPHKRAPDIGVALKAFQVDVLGIDQLVRDGSMGVVAVGTLHLAFPNGMMGLPQQLWCDLAMTPRTNFGLSGFGQVFGIFLMDTMAVGAGKRSGFMLAGGPHGYLTLVVALETNFVLHILRFRRFGTQPKNPAPFAIFGVLSAGTMTGFADKLGIPGGRRSGVALDAVNVLPEILVNFFMAFHAGFITGIIALQLAAPDSGRKEK